MLLRASIAIPVLCASLAAQSPLELGQTAFKAGRWSEAESAFRRSVAAGPKDATAQFWLGRTLLALDRAPEAEGHLEQAVALQPNSSDHHLWLGNAIGMQAQRASTLKQPFMARRIKAEYETAVRLDPDNLDAREGIFQFYLQAPGFMGGGLDKAQATQREVAKRNAYRGLFMQAAIAQKQKDDAAVERTYRTAFAQYPDSAGPLNNLASLLVSKERTPEAWQVIDAFAKRRPGDPLTLYVVGRAAAVTGQQLERGEQALKQYLALPAPAPGGPLPLPTSAHYRLGQIYEKQGKRDAARAAYQTALRLNADNRGAKDALKKLGG